MILYDNDGTDTNTKMEKSIPKRSKQLQKGRQLFTCTSNNI